MSAVVDEATLILAPERARVALATTTTAMKLFITMNGRRPSDEALASYFLTQAREVGCTVEDIDWLVAAELLPEDIRGLWAEADHAHDS